MLPDWKRKNFDFKLILFVLALNVIGILMIASATDQNSVMVQRQIIGVLGGLAVMFVLAFIPYQKTLRFAPVYYIVCCVFLLLVILYGSIHGGAKRWIVIPVLGQLQPSEFAKAGIILFFAWYLGKHVQSINRLKIILPAAGFAFIPFLLVASEPDLSTSIVILLCILAMVYAAGISYKWVFGILAVIVPFALIFIRLLMDGMIPFLKDYQIRRILAWIDKSKYADLNLQQNNSVMAIGSGQLFGKGLNNSTLSVKGGNFLSEEQTDFIFAVIGEELGFIGCIAVILLYILIVYECFKLAGKAIDAEGKLLCTGMGVWISFQSFCNIAVATGIFPNTGLPLPFISYGVSSLLSLYAGIGIVLNVGLQRKRISDQDDFSLLDQAEFQLRKGV